MSVSDQSESVNEINVEGEGVHFAPRKSSLMEVLEENGESKESEIQQSSQVCDKCRGNTLNI